MFLIHNRYSLSITCHVWHIHPLEFWAMNAYKHCIVLVMQFQLTYLQVIHSNYLLTPLNHKIFTYSTQSQDIYSLHSITRYLLTPLNHEIFTHPTQSRDIYSLHSITRYLLTPLNHKIFTHSTQSQDIYSLHSITRYLLTPLNHKIFTHSIQSQDIYSIHSITRYLLNSLNHKIFTHSTQSRDIYSLHSITQYLLTIHPIFTHSFMFTHSLPIRIKSGEPGIPVFSSHKGLVESIASPKVQSTDFILFLKCLKRR